MLRTLLIIPLLLLAACNRAPTADPTTTTSQPQTQWIDPNTVQQGPILHESLTPEQTARIKKLRETFADVDPEPLDQWVDSFKRDIHPDDEIAIWETMARAFTAYCSKHALTKDAKTEVLQIVLLRSGASEDDVLQHMELKTLTKDDAREIMKAFDAPPKPLTIITK